MQSVWSRFRLRLLHRVRLRSRAPGDVRLGSLHAPLLSNDLLCGGCAVYFGGSAFWLVHPRPAAAGHGRYG